MRNTAIWMSLALCEPARAVCLPVPGAAPPPDRVQELIALRAKADAAEAAGRYDEAIGLWEAMCAITPHPTAIRTIGELHERLDEPEEAAAALRLWLSTAPADPELVAKVAARAQVLEGRAAARRPRPVVVSTTPPGAHVWIDALEGTPVGRTPHRADLVPGPHQIRVALPGHAERRDTLYVKADGSSDVELVLQALPRRGGLRVVVNEPGVGVEIDGEPVGVSPMDREHSVSEGEHRVRFVAPGGTSEVPVRVTAGAVVQARPARSVGLDAASTGASEAAEGGRDVLGWSLVGIASASLVASGVLYLLARREADTSTEPDILRADAREHADAAERNQLGAGVALGVGLAAGAVGAWLLLRDEEEHGAAILPAPCGAVVRLTF